MSKYKLVALDIDGTTINSKGKLSKKTIDTVREVSSKGVPVCIVTGRNAKHAMPIVKKLNVKTPFICNDGAILYDPVDKKIIKQVFLNRDLIKEVTQIADEYNVYMEFATYNNYTKYIKDEKLQKFSYGGVPQNPAEKIKWLMAGQKVVDNLNKIYNMKAEVSQLIIGGEEEDIEAIHNKIKNIDLKGAIIRNDLWENYLFIVVDKAIKSEGVNILCDHYGITQEQVIAMGDQMNDIDMIINAGLGVAMDNAHEKIKANANYITKSNDEDGVAYALEKFILKG